MNMVRLAAALGIGILVSSAGFVACSSSDSSNNPPPAGKDGSTDSSTNTDTGTNPPPDAGPLEAGPSDPKSIKCNGAVCSSADHNCCVQSNGQQACNANPPAGPACNGAIEIHCDEQPDCNTGEVCCVDITVSTPLVACKPSANCKRTDNKYQLCKTDKECDTGVKCTTQNCNGLSVSSCGGIPGCN
ncbi:hypothetical protein [Pendulispora albinea]|uniref:Secreted protein n=1 Tax=Pendulispora albinea TaxID=2741071 RepID=A0ABZ2LX69_9BACT